MEWPKRREDSAGKFLSGNTYDHQPANDDEDNLLERLGFKRDSDGNMIVEEDGFYFENGQ